MKQINFEKLVTFLCQ